MDSPTVERIERTEEGRTAKTAHIKSANIMMGIGREANKLHLIDFGMAMKRQSADTDRNPQSHIRCTQNNKFAGTADLASVNTHCGLQPSRRDDMKSTGLVLIYLAQGSLPWKEVTDGNREQIRLQVVEQRLEISNEQLCRGLPQEFQTYMEYVSQPSFASKSDSKCSSSSRGR